MTKNDNKIKIGLLGAGVVGSGVITALKDHPCIEIKKIGVRDLNKQRDCNGLDKNVFTTNLDEVVSDPDTDIVVEVLGGLNPAKDFVLKLSLIHI